ncbi:MAG: DUF2318 domain-containing protein [Clostridiales bacterium]|jgi:uncharacterized membrane protein|nr:DUF2318 domain-containing protein [Clostridiales bacterium]
MSQTKKTYLQGSGQSGKRPPKKQVKKNKWLLLTGIASVFVIAVVMIAVLNRSADITGSGDTNAGNNNAVSADAKTADNYASQDLVIPIGDVSTTAEFYPVTVDGVDLEIIAVEASDGTIRTAFNTCQVCYDSGRGYYEQSGDVLVCQNCGNRFMMSQVEIESGGCNPWPIFAEDKTVTDEYITISYDFLQESTGIFANWKGNY